MLYESWFVTSQPVNMRHKTVKNTIALAIDHWWLFCHSLWICMKKWRHESQSQSPLQSPILKIGVTKLMTTTTTLFSQSSVSSMVLCLLSSNAFRHKWGGGPHGEKREINFPIPCKFSLLWLEALFSVKLFSLYDSVCGDNYPPLLFTSFFWILLTSRAMGFV